MLLMISGVVQAAYITIGQEGNSADTTGYGAVGYTYRISQYEVTIAEFSASGLGSGNENYWNSIGSGAPAVNLSWYEAAQYCNWLTTGDALLGAYQFNGSGTLTNVMSRANILADGGLFFLLPTEDEWYKAAYFKNGVYSLYANGTDTAPTTAESRYGGISPWVVGSSGFQELNGTYDMMGNIYEWTESANDGVLDNLAGESMILRGGYYGSVASVLSSSSAGIPYLIGDAGEIGGGFRVVAIPEPATVLLFGLGGMGAWIFRRSKLKSKEEVDA